MLVKNTYNTMYNNEKFLLWPKVKHLYNYLSWYYL